MKEIVYLSGVSSTGKSTAVRDVFEYLGGIIPSSTNGRIPEIFESLTYKRLCIYFISMGDVLTDKVRKLIDEVLGEDSPYDLLICACRTRQGIKDYIEKAAGEKSHVLHLIRTQRVDVTEIKDERERVKQCLLEKINNIVLEKVS